MKELALKVFRNVAVRRAFMALVLAVAAALGYDSLAGCSPAQIQQANSAIDKAQAESEKLQAEANRLLSCLSNLRETHGLDQPEKLSASDAPAIEAALRACVKPSASDAGAQ